MSFTTDDLLSGIGYWHSKRFPPDFHNSFYEHDLPALQANGHCIVLQHSYLRPRVEQPRKYPKIAQRVHRLKTGQHFDLQGIGTDERSRNRFRSGLYAALRLDKVSVRGQPDGSVRITKVGEWSGVRA